MTPDKRAMNHMDPETKMVHVRLEAWADWVRTELPREFPSITVLGRVIEQGALGAAQGTAAPINMPEAVAITEKAVLRLGQIDQKVIRAYYFNWAPVEMLARRVHMRRREFENVLRRARWRVSGYINALEDVTH